MIKMVHKNTLNHKALKKFRDLRRKNKMAKTKPDYDPSPIPEQDHTKTGKWNLARNYLLHGDYSSDYKSMSIDDNVMADFAKISYLKERHETYMNHVYDPEYSDSRHAVYHGKG